MNLTILRRAPWLLACGALAACAAYHPAPLATAPALQDQVTALRHVLPDGRAIALGTPLALPDVAALAVLNNPDLVAARAQHDIAAAELLSAGLPPDPTISGGFAALVSGAATMPSISAGFMQDVGALVTYKARQAGGAGRPCPGGCRYFVAGMAGRRPGGAAGCQPGRRPGDDRQPAPGYHPPGGGGCANPASGSARQFEPDGWRREPDGAGRGAGRTRHGGAEPGA